MATYSLKFDHAPDTNADGHTSTLRMWCCGELLGDKTSGPANHATITNWVEQSFDVTAHMTTGQPKANHYPAWQYLSGDDGSRVRHLRIESSGGSTWHDQYGGDDGHAANGVGSDGSGTASQYQPGSYSTLVGSGARVDHIVVGTDASADYPALRIEWEQAGDNVSGTTDDGVSAITVQGRTSSGGAWSTLGTRTGELAGAFWKDSGTSRAWASRSIPLSGSTFYGMRWQYSSGADANNIRNVRVLDNNDNAVGDQFLSNGWAAADTTGTDGSGAAQQPDPSQVPPGTFTNTLDGWCHHEFPSLAWTSSTRVLKFDVAPDNTASGGSGHRTRISCYMNGTYLGDVQSAPESGNDGVFEWSERFFDVTSEWVGDGTDEFTWRYYTGTTTAPWNDEGHVRNARIEDGDGAVVEGDQFYPTFHGSVAEAATSGLDGSTRVSNMRNVCSYTYTSSETVGGDGFIAHGFPGVRCRPLRPTVGYIGLG